MTDPADNPPPASDSQTPELYGLLAEFEDVDAVMKAARHMRDEGFEQWDVHSPFPIHGIDEAMGIKPTILPWIVLGGGVAGCLGGLFIAWWANATSFGFVPTYELRGYEFLISGKPLFSLPANIPVIFETTILLAAFGAVFGMLILNQLPLLSHPLLKKPRFERVTSDRFFVSVKWSDPKFDRQRTAEMLRELGASCVEEVEY
mgnify:CR=1 FL=1